MSGMQKLPQDPQQLVAILVRQNVSEEVRERIWQRLNEVIRRLARRTWSGLGEVEEQEAVSYVWELVECQGKYDPQKGRFESWCRTVLYNWFADLRKARSREITLSDEGHRQVEDKRIDTSDAWLERLNHLRVELDGLELQLAPRNPVDYYAVLLVRMRLTAIQRVAGLRAKGQLDDWRHSAEWVVKWHDWEGQLAFRNGWPKLEHVWEGCCVLLVDPPYRIDAGQLGRVIAELSGGQAQLPPELWHQWVQRVRKKAKACVAPSKWDELFAAYFPRY